MIRLLTLLAALAGLVAYFVLSVQMEKSIVDSISVVNKPPESPFDHTIGASGIVEAEGDNVNVASMVSGVAERVFVSVGKTVKKGDSLFQVEASTEQTALASSIKEVSVLEAAVEVVSKQLDESRDADRRTGSLMSANVVSDQEGVQARLDLAKAEAQFAKAQADLELGKARVEEARAALNRTLVKAPRDGEILQLNIREGEYTQPFDGNSPIVLGETRRLQVRAVIDEYDARRLRPDTKAVAYLRGDRTKSFPLSFSHIEPLVVPKTSLTGAPAERVDTRVLNVIYTFDPPEWPIYVGQQLDVFIDAEGSSTAH